MIIVLSSDQLKIAPPGIAVGQTESWEIGKVSTAANLQEQQKTTPTGWNFTMWEREQNWGKPSRSNFKECMNILR